MIRAYRHTWSRWKLGRGATNAFAYHCGPQRPWSSHSSTPSISTNDCRNSELHLVDSGHFVWEHAADEYAALVNAWWAGGYKTCGKSTRQGAA